MLIDNIMSLVEPDSQKYRIFLKKTNGEMIRELTRQCFDREYSPKLGGSREFSFRIYKKNTNYYDDIVGKAIINVKQGSNDLGDFEIQNVTTSTDGIKEHKVVKCLSADIKLAWTRVYVTEGVFKLRDDANPSRGILNIVTTLAPYWQIGYVDPVLINQERYFDISDTNVYDLLMNKVQDTYNCVFVFNTINYTIHVFSLSNFGTDKSIILSTKNLAKSINLETITDEIVTKLNIYGDGGLDVRDVNLGQTYLLDLTFFKNTKYMTQSLINAINAYDAKVATATTTYTGHLNNLYTFNTQLTTANADLLELENQLSALNAQKGYLLSLNQTLTSINTEINNKQIEITAKQNQINSINGSITSTQNAINTLVSSLNVNTNFTLAQRQEMSKFITEETYQDSSFFVSEDAPYTQQVDVQKKLLQNGKERLARVAYPRYKADIDIVDFLQLKEFQPWWNQLGLGDRIRLDEEGLFQTMVRVVAYTHNCDTNSLKIQLGDKYRFDDAIIELKDLIQGSVSTSVSFDFKNTGWNAVANDRNQVLDFINSSIDLAKNSIIGGERNEITIDTSGYWGRRWDTNANNYSPEQIRITNNAIVLSNDAFNSAKMAIGKLANGQYGISAEIIAGKMILGNNMIIETGSGDFRVDGTGVNITKMSLNMTSTNNLNRIVLNPNNGFRIQTRPNVSSSFSDRFYVDTFGNLQFSGNLNGASGTFSGNLQAATGTFSGTVQASTIIGGTIQGTTITGGFVNGAVVSGGTVVGASINGGDLTIGSSGTVSIENINGYGTIEFIGSGNTSRISQTGGNLLNINSSGQLWLTAGSITMFGSSITFQTTPDVGGTPLAKITDIPSFSGYATEYYVQNYAVQDIYNDGLGLTISGNKLYVKQYGSTVGYVDLK